MALFRANFAPVEGDALKKLMKDYPAVKDRPERVVDRAMLVGRANSTADKLINNAEGSAGDTGLYELYANVVKPFVDKLIENAEAYANDTTSFKDRKGKTQQGVSYSFGAHDTISEYQGSVSSSVSAPDPYPTGPDKYYDEDNQKTYDSYRGDLDASTVGEQQFAGLFQKEFNIWKNLTCTQSTDFKAHKYYRHHWAGIDCSGYVQRVINMSDPTISESAGLIGIDTDVLDVDKDKDYCHPDTNKWSPITRYSASMFFGYDNLKPTMVTKLSSQGDAKMFSKGDLLYYEDHITMVHSDSVICRDITDYLRKEYKFCGYEIIHASGDNKIYYDTTVESGFNDFNRKVVINRIDFDLNKTHHGKLRNPEKLGRITIWE